MAVAERAICPLCPLVDGNYQFFSQRNEAEAHLQANPTHYLVGRGIVWVN